MKFHPRIKKSRLNTSCRDEILQQTCFYLFFDACTICLSPLTDLNINKVRRKILQGIFIKMEEGKSLPLTFFVKFTKI